MREVGVTEKDRRSFSAWIRHNVIDVAPLWVQLYRSALANVRIH